MRMFASFAFSIFIFVTISHGYFHAEDHDVHVIRNPDAALNDGLYVDRSLHAPKSDPEVDFEFQAGNIAIRKVPCPLCPQTSVDFIFVSNVHKLTFLIHPDARGSLDSRTTACRRDLVPRSKSSQWLKACFRPKVDKPPPDPRRIHGVLNCRSLHSRPSQFGPPSLDCYDLVTCVKRRIKKRPDRVLEPHHLRMCQFDCQCEAPVY